MTDSRNTIIEIRAGTGGEEAALFAADLFRMYSKFADAQGWKVELMDTSPSERGGFKEIVFSMLGQDVCAVIRQRDGSEPLEVDALHAFLADRLADYKHPRKVVRFVEPLPRNAMGKLDKGAITNSISLGG